MIQSLESNLAALTTSTKLKNSLTRNFPRRLTDKKATSNFLKSASKDPLQIDQKQKCIMFNLSIGAYAKCLLPLMKHWES